MYVARFSRNGLRCRVVILEKHWSKEMLTNEATIINEKRFFLHSSGYRWMNKEIARILFEQHKLEIIDG
jgi:hypothetical protein